MTDRRGGAGFSLTELLIVLAIGAVLLGIALADLRQVIRAQQLKVAVADLFGAIGLTRAQAIGRGATVVLIAADAARRDWSHGWVVFVDRDGDRVPGAGDEVIAVHAPLADSISAESAFSGKQGASYIAYNMAGRSCSDTSSQAARWGTISLFQDRQTRRIKINMLGRARACDPARDGAGCDGPDPPAEAAAPPNL